MVQEVKVTELSVGRYEFFKEKGRSDASIAKQYGMDHNQLNKWKKEHDLIGKDYGLRGKRLNDVKTVSIEEEPKLLKENDLPKYNPNKAIQEKLKAKESEPTIVNVKESDFLVPESSDNGTIGEIPEPTPEPIPDAILEEILKPGPQKSSYVSELEAEVAELKKQLDESRNSQLIGKVNDAVKSERYRQNKLYGHQRHTHGDWLMILAEEFGEVSQAMQKAKGWGKSSDADDLYEELIHVAAVASAIAEQVLEERE